MRKRRNRDSSLTVVEQLCFAAAAAVGGAILGGIAGALVGAFFSEPTDEMGGPAMLLGVIGMLCGFLVGITLPWMLPDGDRKR